VQRARLGLSGLFILGIFVQVYLAGRGAFGADSYQAHKDFANVIHIVAGVVLLVTLAGREMRNRVDIGLAVLLIVLFEVQYALADLKHPDVGAFHPVNALLILAVAAALFVRDLRAVRGSAQLSR
jgi:hypothetical membrane protein